jgi:hypothetical protein
MGLSDGLVCLVDNVNVVPLHFVDSEEIECTLPPTMSPGVLSVSLAWGGMRVSNEHNFTLVGLKVKSIYPSFGDTRGGTLVFVNLEDVGSSLVSHCIFGD